MSETVKEKEKTKWMEQNGGKGLEVIRRKERREGDTKRVSEKERQKQRKKKRNHEKGTGKHREVQSETMRN